MVSQACTGSFLITTWLGWLALLVGFVAAALDDCRLPPAPPATRGTKAP